MVLNLQKCFFYWTSCTAAGSHRRKLLSAAGVFTLWRPNNCWSWSVGNHEKGWLFKRIYNPGGSFRNCQKGYRIRKAFST